MIRGQRSQSPSAGAHPAGEIISKTRAAKGPGVDGQLELGAESQLLGAIDSPRRQRHSRNLARGRESVTSDDPRPSPCHTRPALQLYIARHSTSGAGVKSTAPFLVEKPCGAETSRLPVIRASNGRSERRKSGSNPLAGGRHARSRVRAAARGFRRTRTTWSYTTRAPAGRASAW